MLGFIPDWIWGLVIIFGLSLWIRSEASAVCEKKIEEVGLGGDIEELEFDIEDLKERVKKLEKKNK